MEGVRKRMADIVVSVSKIGRRWIKRRDGKQAGRIVTMTPVWSVAKGDHCRLIRSPWEAATLSIHLDISISLCIYTTAIEAKQNRKGSGHNKLLHPFRLLDTLSQRRVLTGALSSLRVEENCNFWGETPPENLKRQGFFFDVRFDGRYIIEGDGYFYK